MRDGQTHPHRPRLVVSHSTCPPLSSSPHAHSFVVGPAVIKHTHPVQNTSSPALGGLQIPRWLGSDPLSAWWLGLAPATLEFWVRFPNERNQGKQAHPVLKYRVPHGSQPRPGWAPDPLMVGIRSPDGLVVGLAPATLEFWVRFPNERNQRLRATTGAPSPTTSLSQAGSAGMECRRRRARHRRPPGPSPTQVPGTAMTQSVTTTRTPTSPTLVQ